MEKEREMNEKKKEKRNIKERKRQNSDQIGNDSDDSDRKLSQLVLQFYVRQYSLIG